MVQNSGVHQLIGSLSHYLQGFIYPKWWSPDFSPINSGKETQLPEIDQQWNYILDSPSPHQGCNPSQGFGWDSLYTKHVLGGGFKYFLFSSLLGEDSHFD